MSRQYRNHYSHANHSSMRFRFGVGDPFGYQRRVEADMKRDLDNQAAKNNPQLKVKDTNDRYVFLGLTIGLIVGGIATGVTGVLLHWQFFTIFFSVFGGLVVGGLLGALIVRLTILINNLKKTKKNKQIITNGKTHA